ncbi:Helix-turn-helix domain-containing protein [Collimonas sp. OK242]|uniref:helix-turn-helix transcriptional regulator n=1 Tax=Collimonas sp. OK242 TaxID=1798195 RepID=UPI000896D0B8|nr:helix-turn-helix transcriptional regulator [Collimonas sp. OK242]SDY97953.1 Helix-turn-helix domain-containing protein [Collimonas sp. OK242]
MPHQLNSTPTLSQQAPSHLEANSTEELGSFLRVRRESLDPVHLGLPRSGRRRTPGLRREDVAALADIGITWYTKLEQGRPIRVSAKVLSAVAIALQCSDVETAHLFALAGMKMPTNLTERPACESLSATSQMILDHLNPIPALIQNARFDILGYNEAYCRLVNVDLAKIAKEDRNCIYLAMTNPNWRASLADWDDAMPRMVALFRAAMAEHLHEPLWEQQLQKFMTASAEFRNAWQRYEVRGIENQVKRFRHPRVGALDLQQTNWWSAPKNGDRLMAYVPVDERSRQGIQQLAEE